MHVTEHLKAAKEAISFEIIPPLRGGNLKTLLQVVEELRPYQPPFIDVTSHAAEPHIKDSAKGQRQVIARKRPGTLGLCAVIQHKYDIDAVPHVLCRGFTQQETEDFLIEMHYAGIENLLALQGDNKGYQKPIPAGRTINTYASHLVQQITALNHGRYLEIEDPDAATNFCIGVACYPERLQGATATEELLYLKQKVDAGAKYLVTQMFFDNQQYFAAVKNCRDAGLDLPVVPGLKILTSKKQLESIPRTFQATLPEELVREVSKARDEHVAEIGVSWAARQIEGLYAAGVPLAHLYIMQDIKPVHALMKKLRR